MAAYYNENDPKTAEWLWQLILAGHIADGAVDTRSIEDVEPADLGGFTQCHFFAGIGGWSYALRLAGWPDDQPIWTGSCPCQPFSSAGKRKGFVDKRHLWPAWFQLIQQCQPLTIAGEQVATALDWYDLVSGDLEGESYKVGAAIVGAHSVGSPHIRQRLYWVADSMRESSEWRTRAISGTQAEVDSARSQDGRIVDRSSTGSQNGSSGLADSNPSRCRERRASEASDWRDETRQQFAGFCDAGRLGNNNNNRFQGSTSQDVQGTRGQDEGRAVGCSDSASIKRMADDYGSGEQSSIRGVQFGRLTQDSLKTGWHNPLDGFWREADWLWCADNKYRPVEPSTFPLAHGLPARVGRLRGYGNAIVPQVAAEFIKAYLETTL